MKPEEVLKNNKIDSIICDRYTGDYIINSMEDYAKYQSIEFAKYISINKLSSKSIDELYQEFKINFI